MGNIIMCEEGSQ